MLLAYLGAILYAGKSPYDDREFLLIFNALLVGVMAIILFSIAENAKTAGNRLSTLLLFLLSVVTILVNGIALSAIVFRISEWGLTPNRAAVLGGNLLILVNLLLVTGKLFRVVTRRADLTGVGQSIAAFLPVYSLWTVCVVFLFPLLFGFK
jgi:membrane-associated HD superfamily phosphohydrolase